MAPPNTQKRVKGVQVYRPFVYGTTSRLFDDSNPKPEGTPPDHTHSWTVFVKGVDDTDITYWCKKVQFKLHESIPNSIRMVDDVAPGGAFEVHETGWGEFEITIKIYYVPESQEKPQTLYHHLRLHPYGDTDEQKEKMRQDKIVTSHVYEEQLFNEPYDHFYEILTSPVDKVKGAGKSTKTMRGGMVSGVGERTALIPLTNRPGQPFSRETEKMEIKRLREAKQKVDEMIQATQKDLRDKEQELATLKQAA